ncbi:MAG: hypothetical protein GX596_03945 [Propionibacterium sp.]|nr:hypothetical protein [Propionibacterium sp.]
MRKLLLAAAAVMTAIAAAIGATQATALPAAPKPAPAVTGIPAPCVSINDWPEDASIAEIQTQIEQTFNFRLDGSQWTEEHRPSSKILWETLDALECTDYRENLQSKYSGTVGINATSIRGWAWGDWSLTRTGYVSLDFDKFKGALEADDEGRLVRLIVHELAHVLNSDRHQNPQYWQDFQRLHRQEGKFSDYGARSVTETWADVVGYYVGRCALNNPYDTGEHGAYYEFAKERVFGGKEFGPAPGEDMNCAVPKEGAEEPRPGNEADETASWVSDLAGE